MLENSHFSPVSQEDCLIPKTQQKTKFILDAMLENCYLDSPQQIRTLSKAQTDRQMAVPIWHHANCCEEQGHKSS